MRLKGKAVVITGASMGIGEALARTFVEQGADVLMSSRELNRVEAARARIGFKHLEKTMAAKCDVTQREDVDRLRDLALKTFGHIDVWINNAGHGLNDSVEHMEMAEVRRMFDTNLFGALNGMQSVIPQMKAQGSGAIINISSVAGYIAVPYMAAYCATKHALNAFSHAARVELAGTGVNVLNVCPGYIKTNFASNLVRGKERYRYGGADRPGATPEDVADATLKAYLKGKREIVVPASNQWAIRMYQHSPALVDRTMKKGMKRTESEPAAQPPAKK
ncbi:MAG: SDR family NAD(P)-dependent oxidoreductase [Candidatus Koribacter versatilis]|uniref:SDR family NAD(P)-dependent oxidoreductase n=1 Tax=Candidatus Korobacter versatilis TaxID=658062 RepID=A0A932A870_9BACT|nr:SDR family NAD(P)-dependent oxidoreductase [Candidatus Koribacter versatilis]